MGIQSDRPSATALRTFAAMKKEHDLKIPAKLKLDLLNVISEAVTLVTMNNTVYTVWQVFTDVSEKRIFRVEEYFNQ